VKCEKGLDFSIDIIYNMSIEKSTSTKEKIFMLSQHYLKSCTTEKLIALRRDCCENIADHYMFVMGTLQNRMHCCKKEGCMCMRKTEPQLHGPYDYLAHRGGEKPGMLVLNNNQLRSAKKMVNNYDKLWKYL